LSDAFQNISSSINYASRIQKSILPANDDLSRRFDEHFVIWEPRDVVGGDVYWCHAWGEGQLVLLGDCTGHGVPGAFMTLISTGALERAMGEVDIGDVPALVQRMHQLVRRALGQDGANANANDGLELGACYVQPDGKQLTFVGARFDLFVVRDGSVELVKSCKKGIGYPEVPADQVFEPSVIDAAPGTRFYLTTDGAIDQINEAERRRFGKARFKQLLMAVQEMPMPVQGEEILKTIEEYQGGAPRLDDIAVVGFNIG
jgi:serine phosphatase RsbU (regulator of sigma subunit)